MLMARLYGEEESAKLKVAWMPIMHVVVERGRIFNWGYILLANLMLAITAAQMTKPETPSMIRRISTYVHLKVCLKNALTIFLTHEQHLQQFNESYKLK